MPPLRERGEDIILLTRLFLRNFIEKNNTNKVELTEDAKSLLMAYHWPGNVRQLKSIIEQVALFEAGNTVDAATLSQYMPNARETALTVQSSPNYDYNVDREMLYNFMLSTKNEIDKIKKRLDGMDAPTHVGSAVHDLKRETNPLLGISGNDAQARDIDSPYRNMQASAQELVHVDELPLDVEGEQVKTLEETERETIESALRRNNGRRKASAQELNISERTLYRKIKQYNLDL